MDTDSSESSSSTSSNENQEHSHLPQHMLLLSSTGSLQIPIAYQSTKNNDDINNNDNNIEIESSPAYSLRGSNIWFRSRATTGSGGIWSNGMRFRPSMTDATKSYRDYREFLDISDASSNTFSDHENDISASSWTSFFWGSPNFHRNRNSTNSNSTSNSTNYSPYATTSRTLESWQETHDSSTTYSVGLSLALILWVLYLILPKGLRQYMCQAYPKRHVVSRDLERPLVQLVMEDREYRVAQGLVRNGVNDNANAGAEDGTSTGGGRRQEPMVRQGINMGNYTYGSHGTKAVGGANAGGGGAISPPWSSSGAGSSNSGILRRRTQHQGFNHNHNHHNQGADLLEVPALTKHLLVGRMDSGIGQGRQALLPANSSGLSTTMDEMSRGFVSPLSTPRSSSFLLREGTARSVVTSTSASQSSLSSVGRAIWGSDEGRGGKHDSSPRKRAKGRFMKQANHGSPRGRLAAVSSHDREEEDGIMDTLTLRQSKTMDESVSGGSDSTRTSRSSPGGGDDLISFDEEDPRNTSTYPVSPPLSEALLSIGSPFGAGESPQPRSPPRRHLTQNTGTTPTSFLSSSTTNTSTASTNSTNSSFFPDPSPYHPNLRSEHKPPSQMVLSSTMTSLRDPGTRLSAHGTQCQPRRIWIRLDIHAEAIQWRTETLPSSTIGNAGAESNDEDGDGGSSPTSKSSLITLGPIHSIALTDILYVDVGKTTAALSKLNSQKIPSHLCFSLLTSNGSLDLQAGSRLERDALISCFCLILDTVSFQYIQDAQDEGCGTDRPSNWRDMNLDEDDEEDGNDKTYVLTSPERGRYSPRRDRYDRGDSTVMSDSEKSTAGTNVFSGIGSDSGGSDVFVGLTSPAESKASI